MTLKAFARVVLDKLELSLVYYRWYEWRWSKLHSNEVVAAPDGKPLPSPYLMTLVAGGPDAKWFLELGKGCADAFAKAAAGGGVPFDQAKNILDFGCGCGRIIRHLRAMTSAELHGMDYNPRLVAWCQRNLAGTFARNRFRPPIPAADGQFDIVYLMSVFTHLAIETQREWLDELKRVTRTGGLVLATFHDEDHATMPDKPGLREALSSQGFLVHNPQGEGSNFTATFQTREFARKLFGERFEVLAITPSSETGIKQALAVLRS